MIYADKSKDPEPDVCLVRFGDPWGSEDEEEPKEDRGNVRSPRGGGRSAGLLFPPGHSTKQS